MCARFGLTFLFAYLQNLLEEYIYNHGTGQVHDIVKDGITVYGRKTYEKVKEELQGQTVELMPRERAIALQMAHADKAYCHPPKEIDEEEYIRCRECLPPEKWETVDGVNIFRMCEYMTQNITAHYGRVNNAKRYFTARYRTSVPYTKIALDFRKACEQPPAT